MIAAPARRPSRAGRRAGPGRRALLACAVLLAFLWQSLLLQTHAHAPLRIDAGQGAAAVAAPAGHAPSDDPQTCPVCRAAAQAAHYLSPGEATFPAPPAAATATPPLPLRVWPDRHRPHGWRSRGPPAPAVIR